MLITAMNTAILITATAASLPITSSPLTVGGMVLLTAFTIILLSSMLISSWIAIAILLIYIGGLLVLFTYFIVIHPNQIISTSSLFLVTSFILFSSSLHEQQFHSPSYMHSIISIHNSSTYLLLGSTLLLILLVVVNMSALKGGALRPY